MPRIPTTPTLTLCDDLVTYLLGLWTPAAPNSVRRAYLHRFVLSEQTGRQVVIFPGGYTNKPASRGEDFYEHTVRVVVAEKYFDAADAEVVVPQEWVDERVDFVHEMIVEGFDWSHDNTTGGTAPFNRKLQAISLDVPDSYDAERLQTDKEFWCVIECMFQELI